MTQTAPLTREEMRADIAATLKEDPARIGDDDNLMDLGLDSLQVMDLLSKWESRAPGLDYGALMEAETFSAWWQIVAAQQAVQ